jgi:hypothetical protein
MCPITIGNKAFQWEDVIVLTKEQQDKLFKIGNPDPCYTCLTGFDNNFIETPCNFCTKAVYCLPKYCCGAIEPDIKFLEDQPEHIKKELLIHTTDYSLAYLGCIPCCTVLAILSYFALGIANSCAISCCLKTLPSSIWLIPKLFGAANTCAFPLNRLLIKTKCGCGLQTCPAREKRFE